MANLLQTDSQNYFISPFWSYFALKKKKMNSQHDNLNIHLFTLYELALYIQRFFWVFTLRHVLICTLFHREFTHNLEWFIISYHRYSMWHILLYWQVNYQPKPSPLSAERIFLNFWHQVLSKTPRVWRKSSCAAMTFTNQQFLAP